MVTVSVDLQIFSELDLTVERVLSCRGVLPCCLSDDSTQRFGSFIAVSSWCIEEDGIVKLVEREAAVVPVLARSEANHA